MTVQLNGKELTLKNVMNLRGLVQDLKLKPQNIVIELNEEIIKRDDWNNTLIQEKDRIEIISFVGGG